MQNFEVEFSIGKNVFATMQVTAEDKADAQMKAAKQIKVKVKKAYGK